MTAGRFKNLFQKGTEATEFREKKITYRAFTFKLKHNEIQNLWIWYKVRLENGVKASKIDTILFGTLSDSLAMPDLNIILM